MDSNHEDTPLFDWLGRLTAPAEEPIQESDETDEDTKKAALIADLEDKIEAALPDASPAMTIADARSVLVHGMARGQLKTCTCCGGKIKAYKRKLPSSGAAWLVWLVRRSGPSLDWVDINDYKGTRGGDYAKLKHWGLVEQRPGADDKDTRDSGIWRPTSLGRSFARNEVEVPKYLYLVHGEPLDVEDDETISIEEALGSKFSWSELMESARSA